MSTSELSTEPGEPAGGVSHLLVADDALTVGRWGGSHIAVCGTEVVSGSTATEPVDDPGYCPECVRAAVRWSAEAPPGEAGEADQVAGCHRPPGSGSHPGDR